MHRLISDLTAAEKAIYEHCSSPDSYPLFDHSKHKWQHAGDDIRYSEDGQDDDGDFNYHLELYGGQDGYNNEGPPIYRGAELTAALVTDGNGSDPFLAVFLNSHEVKGDDDE